MIDNPCEWGTSTFLIFSENVGTLVYYTHIFPLLISLFIGFLVLINNPRELVNRIFFFVSIMFSIWVYFDLILWASPSPEDVMFFWSAIVPVEMLMYLGAVYLVYLFSTNKVDASIRLKGLFALTMLPIILFAHTNLNVVGLSPDCDEGAIEGPLIQYMYIMEIVLIVVSLYFIFNGAKKLTGEAKQKLLLIGSATTAFLLFFSAGNLTLLFSMGPFYEQYKLFGMPVFATVVAYSFIRLKAFGVKTLITDLLIAGTWMILFSTLLLETMETARPILLVTLVIFGLMGIQLTLSVRKEVTQRIKLEELTQKLEGANKRLRKLDKMKSEFVSIASHQLRSPLTSIRGYASMLLDGSFGKLPQKAVGAVERIVDSSATMSSSIEDYLNVSRIEAGNMKYELMDFNLKTEAEKIADDKRQEAIKNGLLLTFKSRLQKTGIVNADLGKTRQIIHNLVNNAIKYTPRGTIEIFVHDDEKTKRIYVDIIDSGIGIAAEELDDVFGKFQRAGNANSVNVTGTGLGLFVAQKMSKHMGGEISAFSDGTGHGSTFRLELPQQM